MKPATSKPLRTSDKGTFSGPQVVHAQWAWLQRHQHIMAPSICCLCLCVPITVICRTLMPLCFPLIRPEKTHQMADGKNKSCLFQTERVHHP